MEKVLSNNNYNFSVSDIFVAGFYVFQVALSFLLIFGIEPIKGQITNSFVVALITICLSYPFAVILGLKYRSILGKIKEKKSNIFVLMLLIIFVIAVIGFSIFFYFSYDKSSERSFLAISLSFLQIIIFINNDLIKNEGKQLVKTILFLFIGILFGWGIFNIIRIMLFAGLKFPVGNPLIGIWGLIFYSFSAVWILDKKNIIVDYLFKKRKYLWMLAGIMFLLVLFGGGN